MESPCSLVVMFLNRCVFLGVLIMLSKGAEAVIKLPENVTIPALIMFGDSIVDQGNNNNLKTIVKANFPPYGKDFKGGSATGRFCNGKTPADFIAGELGIKEYLPAYLDPNLQIKDLQTGVSFASGASGYDPQTPSALSVLSMSDQLKLFKEYIRKLKETVGEEKTNNIISNSLYIIVVGSDDIANTYFTLGFRKLQYDVDSYTNFLLKLATQFVQDLYKLGAKRIGVFNIPPVGCVPAQRTIAGGGKRACAESYNQAAQLFNKKLLQALYTYQNSLKDDKARIVSIDVYSPLLDIIQNPKKYGFSVPDKGCCGTGLIEIVVLCNKLDALCSDQDGHIFWDSYHPTERTYKILVDLLLKKYISRFL